ncbi:MAG TPA: hypothetical protein VET89_04555 [Stellaceae bacterium]|nr:hypothetical protein [Stellaceae bacterium]
MRYFVQLLWIVLFAAGADVAAAATFDPAQIAAVDKAADAFAALAKDAYKTGSPPRQADPAARDQLDIVFGTAGLNDGSNPVPFEQIDKLNEWLLRIVQTGMVYVFAGTGIADIAKAQKIDAKAQAQIVKNTVAFAPEMGRFYDAQLAVSRAEIDTVAAEIAAHPEKYKSGKAATGLTHMRGGLTQTLVGVVTTFPVPGLEPAWMRERLLALVAIAPSAAKFLDADQRKQIRDATLQIADTMTDQSVKDGMIAFAKTIMP